MFRVVCSLSTIVCLILFVLLLVSPATYVDAYGVAPDAGAEFMVRRASPMFAGLAVLLWLSRNAGPSQLRSAIGISIAISFAGIALTGIVAFVTGAANGAILVAAGGEFLIAALFLVAIRAR